MTNTQTIEKLNEALTQLIAAYEILQSENKALEDEKVEILFSNEKLQNEIDDLNNEKLNLEGKVSDYDSTNDIQSNKMDGMLNKIQNLLQASSSKKETIEETEEFESLESSIEEENNNVAPKESSSKIDLGRMESLLNGLGNK